MYLHYNSSVFTEKNESTGIIEKLIDRNFTFFSHKQECESSNFPFSFLTFLSAGTNIPFHFATFKMYSFSDMGMIFRSNHISFQTTVQRIGNRSHFLDPKKSCDINWQKRAFEPLPLNTGFTSYMISLSAFVCEADDARQRLLNADYLLRQFVGWYTKERKLDRKYYIKTLNLINRLQRACISPNRCAHPLLGSHADSLQCGQFPKLSFLLIKKKFSILVPKLSNQTFIWPWTCLPKSLKTLKMSLRLYMKI